MCRTRPIEQSSLAGRLQFSQAIVTSHVSRYGSWVLVKSVEAVVVVGVGVVVVVAVVVLAVVTLDEVANMVVVEVVRGFVVEVVIAGQRTLEAPCRATAAVHT